MQMLVSQATVQPVMLVELLILTTLEQQVDMGISHLGVEQLPPEVIIHMADKWWSCVDKDPWQDNYRDSFNRLMFTLKLIIDFFCSFSRLIFITL